jgi:hypothetical protein
LWSNDALGQYGKTAVYQNDYRWQRQPDEDLNLGKRSTFSMSDEKQGSIQIRAELFNISNRTCLPTPSLSGYVARPTAAGGGGTGAFGNINVINALGSNAYRTGQLVARFEF